MSSLATTYLSVDICPCAVPQHVCHGGQQFDESLEHLGTATLLSYGGDTGTSEKGTGWSSAKESTFPYPVYYTHTHTHTVYLLCRSHHPTCKKLNRPEKMMTKMRHTKRAKLYQPPGCR